MKLWLVCFFVLFAGAETAQWLGQLPWLSSAELSMPLTVLGGIGLAIASNYTTLLQPAQPSRSQPLSPLGDATLSTVSAPPALATDTHVTQKSGSRREASISFEILKPKQPS